MTKLIYVVKYVNYLWDKLTKYKFHIHLPDTNISYIYTNVSYDIYIFTYIIIE